MAPCAPRDTACCRVRMQGVEVALAVALLGEGPPGYQLSPLLPRLGIISLYVCPCHGAPRAPEGHLRIPTS